MEDQIAEPAKLWEMPLSETVTWHHFHCDQEESRQQMQTLGMPEEIISAMTTRETRPRYLGTEEGVLLILRGVNLNPGAEPEDMVSLRLWLSANMVVSARPSGRRLQTMQEIKGMVEAGKGPADPALFAQTTVEKLASRIGDVVDSMDEELTQLEHKIEDGETRGVRIRLTEIRTMAAGLRRYLAPQREALDTLFRDRHPLIQGHDSAIREQADRLTRYVEDLDLAREQAILLQDELRGRVGEQQNMRMYVLALVTAVFLPLSFLTGLFGMNVGGLPGVETEDGFFWVAISMVGLAVVVSIAMKLRNWL